MLALDVTTVMVMRTANTAITTALMTRVNFVVSFNFLNNFFFSPRAAIDDPYRPPWQLICFSHVLFIISSPILKK